MFLKQICEVKNEDDSLIFRKKGSDLHFFPQPSLLHSLPPPLSVSLPSFILRFLPSLCLVLSLLGGGGGGRCLLRVNRRGCGAWRGRAGAALRSGGSPGSTGPVRLV